MMKSYEEGNKIYHAIKQGKRNQYQHKVSRKEIEQFKEGFKAGYKAAQKKIYNEGYIYTFTS